MDGNPVTGEPSSDESKEAASITFTEIFDRLCPRYIAMGMTYDEFWNTNTKAHRAYRDAWEQKRQYDNWRLWMQGGYIYEALVKASPLFRPFGKGKVEAGKYSEQPYPLSEKELKEREDAQAEEQAKRFKALLELESEMEKQRRAKESEKQEVSDSADNREH